LEYYLTHFSVYIVKVGGMRVGAARPRHTSQGEDKEKSAGGDAEGGQETSGDHAAASGAKEGKTGASNEATGEGANEAEAST
jgi:hypothetical protein